MLPFGFLFSLLLAQVELIAEQSARASAVAAVLLDELAVVLVVGY
jgi:hypothetical protein